MKLETEMVQLRETVLKQQQSHTCTAHTDLQQNTEHQSQRLTALTQQLRTLHGEGQLSVRADRTETPATGQRTVHTRDEAAAERDTGGERAAEQRDPGPERAGERTPPGQRITSTDTQSSNTALHPKVT